MKIVRGDSRTVLVFNRFVIKFARIRLGWATKTLCYGYQKGRLIKYLRYSINEKASAKRALLLGIRDNWQEFIFFLINRSPFLVPTYFSLFGLFNIQKKGEAPIIQSGDLWSQLWDMTDGAIHIDGHSFSNSNNFCEHDGHLMIVDYGEPKIHGVLKKYGDKIYREFDFAYKYNKDEEIE